MSFTKICEIFVERYGVFVRDFARGRGDGGGDGDGGFDAVVGDRENDGGFGGENVGGNALRPGKVLCEIVHITGRKANATSRVNMTVLGSLGPRMN